MKLEKLGRVLLISYYFAPQNTMGSIRPTKLAKYLTRMGYEVTVLCGEGMTDAKDPILQRDLDELSDVHMVKAWNPLKDIKRRKQAKAEQSSDMDAPAKAAAVQDTQSKSLIGKVADAVYLYLWVLGDRSFQRKAKRELKNLNGTYDAVFSTYAPLCVHEIAFTAQKRGLAKRWIADFRDEVNVSFGWQEGYRKRYMKRIRENADLLTAVSNGFLELMNFDDVGRMLSNGYDREDMGIDTAVLQTPETRCFQSVYCGQFQEGRRGIKGRDISPYFRVMREMVDGGLCDQGELRFVYAGPDGAVFKAFASEYGFEACVVDHGLVTRDKSIQLQRSADVLMMATVNSKHQIGILTGKLFEYMMMDKPIVCLMRGDAQDSELSQVLRQTGMGFCCEEAKGEQDKQELANYCKRLMTRYKERKPLLVEKNAEESDQYDYVNIAKTLAEWIHE